MGTTKLGNTRCAKCDNWYDADYDGCPYCAGLKPPSLSTNKFITMIDGARRVLFILLLVALVVLIYFVATGQLWNFMREILHRAIPALV